MALSSTSCVLLLRSINWWARTRCRSWSVAHTTTSTRCYSMRWSNKPMTTTTRRRRRRRKNTLFPSWMIQVWNEVHDKKGNKLCANCAIWNFVIYYRFRGGQVHHSSAWKRRRLERPPARLSSAHRGHLRAAQASRHVLRLSHSPQRQTQVDARPSNLLHTRSDQECHAWASAQSQRGESNASPLQERVPVLARLRDRDAQRETRSARRSNDRQRPPWRARRVQETLWHTIPKVGIFISINH